MYKSSVETRYKNDSVFHALVDQMRDSLSLYSFTPSELREAAMLASTMHEMQNIRPLVVYPPPAWEKDYKEYGMRMINSVFETKPKPRHFFTDYRSDCKVCTKCNLSDVYVEFSKAECK